MRGVVRHWSFHVEPCILTLRSLNDQGGCIAWSGEPSGSENGSPALQRIELEWNLCLGKSDSRIS